jgi:hypothetical protein
MRISRTTGFISGVLLVALGIWGAVVPFIGPYFHYAFGTTASWHYSTNRLLLDILPGALVVVSGSLLLTTGHRISGAAASWMAIIGGAWFAVGPAFSRIWEHRSAPIGGPLYGSTRQAIELIGYFYGLGALIIALAAFALGRFVSRPALAVEGDETQSAQSAPAARAGQTAKDGAESPRTHRPSRRGTRKLAGPAAAGPTARGRTGRGRSSAPSDDPGAPENGPALAQPERDADERDRQHDAEPEGEAGVVEGVADVKEHL